MAKNSVKAEVLSSIASSSLTTSYQALNSSGFSAPTFMVRIVNGSNMAVLVSYDGVNDNEVVLAGESFQFPSQTNGQPNNNVALWPTNTVIYVKGVAGTGSIFLSSYYC